MSTASKSPIKLPSKAEIFCLFFTVPLEFRNIIQTAPVFVPPSSSPHALTAISVTASPSISPKLQTYAPKISSLSSPIPKPPLVELIL